MATVRNNVLYKACRLTRTSTAASLHILPHYVYRTQSVHKQLTGNVCAINLLRYQQRKHIAVVVYTSGLFSDVY